AQLLPALRAGRDFKLGAAVNGRHFDLGAQRGFHGRNRHGDVNVVGLAAKNRMLARAHNNVEVARAAAATAGIALARQADALTITRPRLDAHRHRLLPRHHAFAAADVTNRALLAAAAAAWASAGDRPAPAGLRHPRA